MSSTPYVKATLAQKLMIASTLRDLESTKSLVRFDDGTCEYGPEVSDAKVAEALGDGITHSMVSSVRENLYGKTRKGMRRVEAIRTSAAPTGLEARVSELEEQVRFLTREWAKAIAKAEGAA